MAESSQPTGATDVGTGATAVAEVSAATTSDRGVDLEVSDPRDIVSEEPDGGNLLVRIWEGLGRETDRGYSTTQSRRTRLADEIPGPLVTPAAGRVATAMRGTTSTGSRAAGRGRVPPGRAPVHGTEESVAIEPPVGSRGFGEAEADRATGASGIASCPGPAGGRSPGPWGVEMPAAGPPSGPPNDRRSRRFRAQNRR